MKTFQLENEPKIKSGFTTPENYFEGFSAKVLQHLPNNEPKVISLFSRRKSWIFAAAAVIIVVLSIPLSLNYFSKPAEIDNATLENYIAYNSTVSDVDLMNLLDENDIQNLNVDIKLDKNNIEDELLTNKNLEQYILN
jgi:hypothetical protein